MKKFRGYIIALLFGLLLLVPSVSKADSGFDFSYDGGGGSSWSSSDYSSSSSSYSGSYSDGSGGSFSIVFIIIIIAVVIIVISVNSKKNGSSVNPNNYKDLVDNERHMTDEEIKEIDSELNKEMLVNKTFELYVALQNAWSEFEYDKIRELVSDELYNNYKMQLETLSMKGQKNIMEDIKLVSGDIVSVKKEGKVETVKVALTIAMKDYIVDKDNKVVRGDKEPHGVSYYITLDRTIGLDERPKFCPNCGAELKGAASQTCKFCGSDLNLTSTDFIISKKENKRQR